MRHALKLHPPILRRLAFAAAATATVVVAAMGSAANWVGHAAAPYLYTDMASLPAEPVTIVLGAKVYPNGAMSTVLKARVQAAVALYDAGKVSKLLMTGDNSSNHYDEVTPMKKYAMAQGVPDSAIVRDFAGFRTFDSCYRARHVFAVDRAVIVTQQFHLARAVYLARRMGIDAVGFTAPDDMSRRSIARLTLREAPASLVAMVDANSPWKRPHFIGPLEPIADNRAGR